MRRLPVPIIPRTVNDTVMLDVRTIETEDFKLVAAGIQNLTGLEK